MRNTCTWKLAGTSTFRLSSAGYYFDVGTNMQNPSKRICKLYEADEGKVLVQPDQSGAEAYIVAYLTPHGNFRDLFLNKIKSHVFVAMHAFKDIWKKRLPHIPVEILCSLPIKDLKSGPGFKELEAMIKDSDNWPAAQRYYFIAKGVCHASNYDIKWSALQLNILQKSEGTVALSKMQAEQLLTIYHGLFPELQGAFHAGVREQITETGMLRNLFGYPRTFYGVRNDKFWKEAYSFIPQSTVGTITNIAVTNCQSCIEQEHKDWDILNNKHDSYLVQCPEAEALECARATKGFIESIDLVSPRGEHFNMKSGVSVGKNWAPFKESNPDGLREIDA